MADTDVMGIGDLKQRFGQIKENMQTRTSRAMVVSAGGVLKRKAKAIAQANGSVRTGAMVKNIAIKREPQAPAGTTQYNLGVRNGGELTKKQKSGAKLAVGKSGRIVKQYQDDPYYWKWVEKGHKIVPAKGGQSLRARRKAATAMVPARPFIGPALVQGRDEAIEAMGARLQKELDKASGP